MDRQKTGWVDEPKGLLDPFLGRKENPSNTQTGKRKKIFTERSMPHVKVQGEVIVETETSGKSTLRNRTNGKRFARVVGGQD